jgi:hypothetical protein
VKRRLVVVSVLVLGLLGLVTTTSLIPAGAATRSTSPVITISDGSVVGSSTLTRTRTSVSFALRTSGLEARHAVTVWWMVFNQPQSCTGTCDMDDLSNPQVDASVLYAAGTVVGAAGRLNLAGSLRVGDADGALAGMGTGTGLQNPAGAAIYLVVRDHGLADPAIVEEQIHTFHVCNPTCTDLQISMHQPS